MRKKLTSLLLSLTLFLGTLLPCLSAQAETSADCSVFYILTVSSEQPVKKLPFYEIDGCFYLSANDIASLSRCTLSQTQDSISFQQGIRNVTITSDGAGQELWGDTFSCPVQKKEAQWLLEAVPMLTYLGVDCEYWEPVLHCRAPQYTIFEIWDENISNTYRNTNVSSLYGDDLKLAMLNDIVMDFIFGHGYSGIAGGGEVYVTDALDEILNVNVLGNETVLAEYDRLSSRLAGSANTDEITDSQDQAYVENMLFLNAYRESARSYCGGMELVEDVPSLGMDFTEYMLKVAAGTPWKERVVDFPLDTLELSKADTQSFQKIAKDFLSDSKLLGAGIKAISFAFPVLEIVTTTAFYNSFDQETRETLGKVFGTEALARLDFDGSPYPYTLPVIRKYQAMLEDKLSTIAAVTARTIMEGLGDCLVDAAVSSVENVLGLSLLKLGLNAGVFVVRIFSSASIESAAGELRGIFISEIQQLTYDILLRAADKINTSQFRDSEQIQQFLDSTALFYREVVAYCQNMQKMQYLLPEYREYLQNTEQTASLKFFQFSNCEAKAVPAYSSLTDDLLKGKLSLDSGFFAPPAQEALTNEQGTTFGCAVTAGENLYYMRFSREALTTMARIFAANDDAVYELVKRGPDGTETVLDTVTGNNRIGRIGNDIVYSTGSADWGRVRWYDAAADEIRDFDTGILVDASGTAFVYRPYTGSSLFGYSIHSLTTNGQDMGFENYVGMEGDTVYLEQNDFVPLASHGNGEMQVFSYDLAEWEETALTTIPQIIDSENMTTTYLAEFMTDASALYFALGATSGTQGLITDGVLYRMDKETQELQLLAEHIVPAFQLMEKDGNTSVIYNYDGIDGPAKIMDAKSGEVTGSVSDGHGSITGGIGKSLWDGEGISAFLDRTGTRYQVLNTQELAQYGFAEYNSFSCRASDVSLQGSLAYVYLCQGSGVSEYGQGQFVPEKILLLEKNLETGELKDIYTQ